MSYRKPLGISVEVGGGPGFLKEVLPELISTDLVHSPWLDVVTDAHALPFRTGSITNLLGVDVLHHFRTPMAFLQEAQRTLVAGGRLILVEPWVTFLSHLVWRYLHEEDCDLRAGVFEADAFESLEAKKPFDGNSALPYLLFGPRAIVTTLASVPHLKPVMIEPFCLFAYLLSLGFKRFTLLPEALYPLLSKFEATTLTWWRSIAAMRVFLVLEKSIG